MEVLIYVYHHLIDEKHNFLITSGKWWCLCIWESALLFSLLLIQFHCSEVLPKEVRWEILPKSIRFCSPQYLLIQTVTDKLVVVRWSLCLAPQYKLKSTRLFSPYWPSDWEVTSPSIWPKKKSQFYLPMQLVTDICLSYSWWCPTSALHDPLYNIYLYRVSLFSNFNYLWYGLSHLTLPFLLWTQRDYSLSLCSRLFTYLMTIFFIPPNLLFLAKQQFASLSRRTLFCKENQYWCHQ